MQDYFNLKPTALLHVIPGGLLNELAEAAETILTDNTHLYEETLDTKPNIVYVIGGLPDLTEKIRDRAYEEVIYNESTFTTTPKIIHTITTIADHIRHLNAIPCFATISPMSLDTWNNTRMQQGKTSYLLHHRQYPTMNYLLNETIMDINNEIMDINSGNNVITPNLAAQIIKKRGKDREHRIKYSKMVDGCHPTKDIITKWIQDLDRVTKSNRYLHNLQ